MYIAYALIAFCVAQINQPIPSWSNTTPIGSLSLLFEHILPSNNSYKILESNKLDGIYLLYDSLQGQSIMSTHILKYNHQGQLIWHQTIGNEFWQNAFIIDDITKDRIADFIILSGTYNSVKDSMENILSVINGKTGKIDTHSCTLNHLWCLLSNKAIDINNDNQVEAIQLDLNMDIRLFSIKSGNILWDKKLLSSELYKEFVPFDVIPSPSQPTIYDIDKDKRFEIFLTFEPYIWCLAANTGFVKWCNEETVARFTGNPVIADCNRDSINDVIEGAILSEEQFGYKKIAIYAYNALNGEIIWQRYLGEYQGVVEPIIKFFNFNDITVLIVAIERSNEVFLLEGKKGFIMDRKTLPFNVKTIIISETNGDSLLEIAFFGTPQWPFRSKIDIFSGMYVYDIEVESVCHNLITNGEDYDIISDFLETPNPTWRQMYKSHIPSIAPKWYTTSNDECEFQFVDDIDNDGFSEVIMLSPANVQEKKLRILRITPASKK